MKSARLSLRIHERSDELVRRAAEQAQVPVGRFVEAAALHAAERVLADRAQFVLADDDWDAFTRMLDRPVRDLPDLERADAAWEQHFGGAG